MTTRHWVFIVSLQLAALYCLYTELVVRKRGVLVHSATFETTHMPSVTLKIWKITDLHLLPAWMQGEVQSQEYSCEVIVGQRSRSTCYVTGESFYPDKFGARMEARQDGGGRRPSALFFLNDKVVRCDFSQPNEGAHWRLE